MTNRHLCVTKILFLSKNWLILQSNICENSLGKRKNKSIFSKYRRGKKQYVNSRSQKKCEFLRQGLSHFCVKK